MKNNEENTLEGQVAIAIANAAKACAKNFIAPLIIVGVAAAHPEEDCAVWVDDTYLTPLDAAAMLKQIAAKMEVDFKGGPFNG